MIRIAVIVPSLLLDQGLVRITEATLASLKSGSDQAELVVVDDSSPIRVPVDWGVKVVRTPQHLGYAGAVNWGIEAVDSDYVCVANNDVSIPPDSIDMLLEALRDTSAGVVCAHPTRPFIDVEAEPREQTKDFFGGLWLISRSTLRHVGLLDERFAPFYFEDTDLWTRVQLHGLKLIQDYRVGVGHIGGATTKRFPNRERVFRLNRKKFYAKWGFDGLRRFHSFSFRRMVDFAIPDSLLR